jgi:hypothetical protein
MERIAARCTANVGTAAHIVRQVSVALMKPPEHKSSRRTRHAWRRVRGKGSLRFAPGITFGPSLLEVLAANVLQPERQAISAAARAKYLTTAICPT